MQKRILEDGTIMKKLLELGLNNKQNNRGKKNAWYDSYPIYKQNQCLPYTVSVKMITQIAKVKVQNIDKKCKKRAQ